MSVSQGSAASATDFNTLKANIQAEINRRYRDTSFRTLATDVEAGGSIDNDNITNMAYNLNYINSDTYPTSSISAGTLIQASTYNGMETAYLTFHGKKNTGTDSGCKSGCLGLCINACRGCQGCGDACGTGCGGGCKGNCGGSCGDYCSGSCGVSTQY